MNKIDLSEMINTQLYKYILLMRIILPIFVRAPGNALSCVCWGVLYENFRWLVCMHTSLVILMFPPIAFKSVSETPPDI
jgi:hypothetical protein